jgi:urease accessory protein
MIKTGLPNSCMKTRSLLSVALLSISLPALARVAGSDHALGFSAGFAHPFSGWGQGISFALMGLLAWRLGRARAASGALGTGTFSVALIFTLAMLAGFAAATRFIGLPYAQFAVAGLLIILGLALALIARPSLMLVAGVALALGYVHGYRHGIQLAGSWAAAAGMLCASFGLVALGIALGLAMQRAPVLSQRVPQALGLAGVAFGIYLFVA